MKANRPVRALPPPTREQIAALAYAIWQDRGCPPNRELEHWIEAERMLTGRVANEREANGTNHTRIDRRFDGESIESELDHVVGAPASRSPTAL